MAKKNKNNASPTGKAKKEEETKVEEETTTDEVAEDETTEEETTTDEAEEESEEDDSEEEVDSEVETEDATGDVTRYGVYMGAGLVAVYNVVNHGPDFIKLAKARAEKIGGEARPYVDPKEPAVEKTVVNIVNASNSLVRQFAKSTHGKDYQKLAEDFLAKYGVKRGYRIQE